MNFYSLTVIDRVTQEQVVVGAMLTIEEVRELTAVLNKFNATDFLIVKGIEKV